MYQINVLIVVLLCIKPLERLYHDNFVTMLSCTCTLYVRVYGKT